MLQTLVISGSGSSLFPTKLLQFTSPVPGWDKSRLSKGLLEAALSELARIYNKSQVIALQAADLRVLATTSKFLFAHFDEIGLTASVQEEVLRYPNQIMAFEPTQEMVNQVRGVLEQHGTIISHESTKKLLSLKIESKQRGLRRISEAGLANVQRDCIRWLHRLTFASADAEASKNIRMIALPQTTPEECAQFQATIDAIKVSSAANGVGCALGCVPCCGIAASLLLLAESLQSIKNAMCSEVTQ